MLSILARRVNKTSNNYCERIFGFCVLINRSCFEINAQQRKPSEIYFLIRKKNLRGALSFRKHG